ncbi:hypothetical protein GCM10010191_86940 [Actinomadura vinacea]|uniref:GNAT family N-acetyltransferase n=1 Tax=Actinomadura vinacea TaxID=115336 RepID=A0ABN3KAY5_9ACTN
MIDFAWYTDLEPGVEAELREMLAGAAREDEEAGFPRLSAEDPVEPGTRRLLVWLLPDERSGVDAPAVPSLAAYLRVEPPRDADGGAGELSYVVRPGYRSRGITTLLLEKMGLDPGGEDGPQRSGAPVLRVWARGDHPAALRLSLRFRCLGIVPERREWRLLIPLREGRAIGTGAEPGGPGVREAPGAAGRTAAAALWAASGRRHLPPSDAQVLISGSGEAPDGAVWIDPRPGERTDFGAAGRLVAVATRQGREGREEDPLIRALLVAGLERLRDAGLRAGAIAVDARNRPLVHEARSLGFTHDRTDVRYTLRSPIAFTSES